MPPLPGLLPCGTLCSWLAFGSCLVSALPLLLSWSGASRSLPEVLWCVLSPSPLQSPHIDSLPAPLSSLLLPLSFSLLPLPSLLLPPPSSLSFPPSFLLPPPSQIAQLPGLPAPLEPVTPQPEVPPLLPPLVSQPRWAVSPPTWGSIFLHLHQACPPTSPSLSRGHSDCRTGPVPGLPLGFVSLSAFITFKIFLTLHTFAFISPRPPPRPPPLKTWLSLQLICTLRADKIFSFMFSET